MTSVSVREVAPRDGLQNEAPIPTDAKVQLIDALSGTGVQRIEAVSFVHPRAIPQMADADEVWARITRNPWVRYSALIPNSRGATRALQAGFREIEVVVSASDTHNRRNLNRSTDESLDDIAGLIPLVHEAGATLEVIVATSFGCPFEGDIAPERVASIVERVRADGADGIGGCPYAPGASGNVATEEVVHMLEDMGIDTGIDLEALIEVAALAEKIVGK